MSHLSARVVPAYAKLNLSLSVVGRRADGFHDIDSILVPIDWHDLVEVSISLATTATVALKVTGPAASGVPADDSNLTVRAARALVGIAGRPLDVRLWLDKAVPHGAGLGGGSGDAAAVFRAGTAALAAMGVVIDRGELAAAALGIGSDVPALLDPGAHRARGAGNGSSGCRPRTSMWSSCPPCRARRPPPTARCFPTKITTTGGRLGSPRCSQLAGRPSRL